MFKCVERCKYTEHPRNPQVIAEESFSYLNLSLNPNRSLDPEQILFDC